MAESGPRSGRVLVVDDQAPNRVLIRTMLARDGHEVLEADGGHLALDIARDADPDVVILDVLMPGIDGFETCAALKQHEQTRLTPVVLLTALRDHADKLRGIEAGADDFLSKPVEPLELSARVRSLIRLKSYTKDLDSAEAVITSLALTIETRDAATQGHCQRLAEYATRLGRVLGLNEDDLSALERGGYLHDIGKVGVPDSVLLKPGLLTPAEFAQMKTHTLIGDRLCGQLRSLRRVRPIVRHHHEKLDGSGYPDGLAGDAIPLLAQITGIADIYDALTTPRPYKPAFTSEEALAEIYCEVDRGWRSRELVDAFVRAISDGVQ
ncbi:MAG: response regulator [Vicinamibacteria bacterium]|nr:response regulator [Vicinamibacteria bacterium]